MTDPRAAYQARLGACRQRIAALEASHLRISNGRLVVALLGAILLWFAIGRGWSPFWPIAAGLMFFALVVVHDRLAVCVIVEVCGAQCGQRPRQRFQERFQFGKFSPLGVGHRRLQPGLNRHNRLTEIDTPSRSGTVAVNNCGWVASRSLYSAMARVLSSSAATGANPGTTLPSHNTLSVTSSPPGRSSETIRSSNGE